MKNKFLLIMISIVLISGVIGVFSFIFIDKQNIDFNKVKYQFENDGFMFNNDTKKVQDKDNTGKTVEISEIKELNLINLNGEIILEKGDKNEINYSGVFLRGFDDVEIIEKDGNLDITQKNSIKDFQMIIYLKDWNKVNTSVENLNGRFVIKQEIKNLDIGNLNGSLRIKGDRAFDICIKQVVGEIYMDFEETDANFTINNVVGLLNIKGHEVLKAMDKSFYKTYGKGEKEILIESLIGKIYVD